MLTIDIQQFEVEIIVEVTQVDFMWKYIVFLGNTKVYRFHSDYGFNATEIDEQRIKDDELRNANLISFKNFQDNSERKCKEHRMFKPIPNLSGDKIQQIALQLSEVPHERLTS